MIRLLALLAIVFAFFLMPVPSAAAAGYPFCQPDQTPQFLFGFSTLKAELGATMGEPVECAHPNDANGDTLQKTTTGLAFWRKATNTPTFTDGYRHWAMTQNGMVQWTGDSVDPPRSATVAPAPPSRPVVPPPVPSPAPARPSVPPGTLRPYVDDLVSRIDGYWAQFFRLNGLRYDPPDQVWWNTRGVCGRNVVWGAAYCNDGSIYLFEDDFRADFNDRKYSAISVVVAHEWGHHIQNILGIQNPTVGQELQADCMAGMYFKYARRQGWITDAGVANAKVKSRMGGDGSHGSGAQRDSAFNNGVSGAPCLEFQLPDLVAP